jgi:hypothetical protein
MFVVQVSATTMFLSTYVSVAGQLLVALTALVSVAQLSTDCIA